MMMIFRNDIAMAITKYDQFDFLIDIVPRDDIKPATRKDDSSVRMAPDQVSRKPVLYTCTEQYSTALEKVSSQDDKDCLCLYNHVRNELVSKLKSSFSHFPFLKSIYNYNLYLVKTKIQECQF